MRLSLTNAEITEGEADIELGVLPGARDDGPDTRVLSWSVRIIDREREARADIEVWSEKGGVARRSVRLPGG